MTAPDLDALIVRMKAPCMEYLCTRCSAERHECIDALVQLRDAEALARGKIAEQVIEIARLKDALRQANGVRDVFASAVVAQAMQDIDPAKEKP